MTNQNINLELNKELALELKQELNLQPGELNLININSVALNNLNNLNQQIIYRILELCQANEFSLVALGQKSQVPLTTIKNILNGASKNPGIITLAKLCQGLGVSLEEFFAGSQFKPK